MGLGPAQSKMELVGRETQWIRGKKARREKNWTVSWPSHSSHESAARVLQHRVISLVVTHNHKFIIIHVVHSKKQCREGVSNICFPNVVVLAVGNRNGHLSHEGVGVLLFVLGPDWQEWIFQ